MGLHEQEGQSLEELDAADEQEVERVQDVVLRVVEQTRPASISELSVRVRAEAGMSTTLSSAPRSFRSPQRQSDPPRHRPRSPAA